jgi:hypothetical protein
MDLMQLICKSIRNVLEGMGVRTQWAGASASVTQGECSAPFNVLGAPNLGGRLGLLTEGGNQFDLVLRYNNRLGYRYIRTKGWSRLSAPFEWEAGDQGWLPRRGENSMVPRTQVKGRM